MRIGQWAIPFHEPTPPIEEQTLKFTPEDTIMAYDPYRTNYSRADTPHWAQLLLLNRVHIMALTIIIPVDTDIKCPSGQDNHV